MKKILIISALAFLAACSVTVKMTANPAEADVQRGNKLFPALTLNSLNEGKLAYESNCGKCHGLFSPLKFNEAKWRKELPPMAKKAKVDANTQNLILQYVVTMNGAVVK